MTCRELLEFVQDYLDGELADAQRQRFDEHLSACPPCRDYLHSYEETVRLGRLVRQDPDADASDVPDALIQAILDARRQ